MLFRSVSQSRYAVQAIKETDWLVFDTVVRINTAKELLQQIVDVYDKSSPTQDAEEVRDN